MDDDLNTDKSTLSLNHQTSVSSDGAAGDPASEHYLAGNQDNCSKFRQDWSEGSCYSAKLASLGMSTCMPRFMVAFNRQPYPS
jgi:hypothetical protein